MQRLLNGNLFHLFWFVYLLEFGEMDVEDAVLHLGFDGVGVHVVRKDEALLELLVGEFAAEIAAVLLAFLVLRLLFHLDMEATLVVHVDVEVFLAKTRSCKFDVVLLVAFDYIDGRSCVSGSFHPAVVEEITKDVRQPAIRSSSDR